MPPPNGILPPESPESPAVQTLETGQSAARGLPAPKKFDLPPEEFFRYYAGLDASFPGRLVLYGYRTLPVTDVTQPLSEEELRLIQQKKKKEPAKNICIEKICPVKEAADWNRWVCESFGAGDYHFKLNDQHPSVKKTIAMTTTKGEGALRNWSSFPPVLHCNDAGELDEVLLNDPMNESYLRWARLNGIKFPGDKDVRQEARQDEETEMASVVETMARQNEALTDKVIRIAENSGKSNGAPPVDATARGQLGAVETVVEGAKQAMGVMGGAMKQMMENQVKAADPQEHVRSAIEMAKMMVPPPGNGNSDLLKIMEMQMSAQREQAKQQLEQQEKSFTRLIESERENHKTVVQMLTARLDSLEKQRSEVPATSDERALDGYLRLRRKFKEAEEEEGTGEDDEPAWMRLGSKIVDGIQSTMANLAAMRANQAPAVQVIPETAPVLPAAAAPAPAPPKDEQMDIRVKYAQTIHKPLIDALKAGRPGYDFAAAIIAEAGQGPYDFLANSGYNGVTQFLQAYPPLWQELISPPIGAPMVEKFIGEFLDREKVMGAIQMAKGQPQRKGPTVNQ